MTAPTTDLELRLLYQTTVIAVLRATTRRDMQPVLSGDERDQMETAYLMGLSAAGFANRLADRDQARAKLLGAPRGAPAA